MPSKAQLEEEINEVLGTQLEWSEMKKDDLELIVELIDDGVLIEPLTKHIVKNRGKEGLDEAVDEWEPGALISKVM